MESEGSLSCSQEKKNSWTSLSYKYVTHGLVKIMSGLYSPETSQI